MSIKFLAIKLIIITIFTINLIHCIPVNNSTFNYAHRSLAKRALSYIANDTVCIIDNKIYQNGDPIPTDDPCELCKCRPPGFACVLRECEVKPGCKEVQVEGECCPSYQCGCEHDGKFYRDGESVPVPSTNELLKCYRCKCRGSSIICGLMDCQYRSGCQARYEEGECCPNYDHCDRSALTSTQQPNENQTVDTSILTSDMSTPFATTLTPTVKTSSALIDLFSPDQTKQVDNESSTSHPSTKLIQEEDSISSKQALHSINTNSATDTNIVNSTNEQSNQLNSTESISSTISSIISSIKDATFEIDNDSNELNKVLTDKQITANSVELNDVKSNQNVTPLVKEESVGEIDDKLVSNNNIIKDSLASSIASKEVTTSLNQVEIDRRNDEIADKKLIDNKNEILDVEQSVAQMTTLSPNNIKLDEKEDDKVQSSTTVPNITDTTILAPIPSSLVNFITQSPLVSTVTNAQLKSEMKELKEALKNDAKEELKNESEDLKDDKKDKEVVVEKRNEDLSELVRNDTIIDVNNKDEISVDIKEADDNLNQTDKINDKLDDKISMNFDEELKTPLKLLKKVLDNCTNNRCRSMESLIKVTRNVLSELDDKIVEKIKSTDAFEHLKTSLLGNSTDIGKLDKQPPTDSPFLNTTDSSIELEEYPTTIRYLKISELSAEHKDIDDLELEEDNKAYGLI